MIPRAGLAGSLGLPGGVAVQVPADGEGNAGRQDVARYFAVGNAVLGNNITARARAGVWMVAKALGLRQSITDGGIYTPDAVPHFRGKKPGLDTLSRPWGWEDRKNRQRGYVPLPSFEWGTGRARTPRPWPTSTPSGGPTA